MFCGVVVGTGMMSRGVVVGTGMMSCGVVVGTGMMSCGVGLTTITHSMYIRIVYFLCSIDSRAGTVKSVERKLSDIESIVSRCAYMCSYVRMCVCVCLCV